MRSRTIYREGKNGEVIREPCEVAPYRRNDQLEDFNTRMRKTLYQLECSEGSRFRVPGYSKSKLREVWTNAA